ncbi:hypothetical protein [Streptomyces sp. NPDC050422]|uniref:hypothetical protein n=1 Tax=Streptomyces sp. NPDC050422 TaxID=3365614 RepID=UPI003787FFE5
MGLMSWLRGGRSTDAAAHPAAADAPRPSRGDRVDVSRLEPVQRSVTGQDLVIDPGGFQAALTTRQETALGTPLGHLVSPDAPAGLVHGVALAAPGSPAPAVQRAVEMPLRPRSRLAPVAVQRAYGDGAPALTSAGGSSAAAALPVRQLVGEQPLVQRVEPAEGTAAGASAGAEASPDAVQRTGAAPPPQPPRRTPGLGAPLAGLPPTAQRQADRSPAAQPPVTRPPLVQRESSPARTVGESPVPADGAMPAGPETSAAAEAAEAVAGEVSDVAEPIAPLLGDAPLAGTAPSGGEAGGESPAPAPTAQMPIAPVQRSIASPGPTPVPLPQVGPIGPTAPLLGDRPLSLQNAGVPAGPPPLAGAAVQRSAGDGGVPGAEGTPPPSTPDAQPVRWITPDPGTPPGIPPAAPVQRAVPPVQRQTGAAPPVPRSVARSTDRATFPTAGSVAVAAGVAQRMADGSVVFGAAPLHGTSRPVVQRDTEIAEEPPPLPEPEPPPVTEPEPEPEAAAGPESMPGAPDPQTRAGSPTGQGSPPVTDELVRALYGPLSRLLKADLRLERERAGFLINTRH